MDLSLLKVPLKNRLEIVQLERATSTPEIDAKFILGSIAGLVIMLCFAIIVL